MRDKLSFSHQVRHDEDMKIDMPFSDQVRSKLAVPGHTKHFALVNPVERREGSKRSRPQQNLCTPARKERRMDG